LQKSSILCFSQVRNVGKFTASRENNYTQNCQHSCAISITSKNMLQDGCQHVEEVTETEFIYTLNWIIFRSSKTKRCTAQWR